MSARRVVANPRFCASALLRFCASALLRLIAGLEVADAGEIALGGKRVSGPGLHLPSEAPGVGFVFQSYALWPHLDVRGNVAFPLEAAGLRAVEAARRAERHLTTVALEHYASRKPAELSGGQRQRVALARCLAQDAGIILVDEPLANLDPHLRATMEEELVAFHRAAAATTVYITHDQREAMAVADRMAVMAAGRFLQVGAPNEVYARPASAEVARFIGEGVVHPVTVTDGGVSLAGQPVPVQGGGWGRRAATGIVPAQGSGRHGARRGARADRACYGGALSRRLLGGETGGRWPHRPRPPAPAAARASGR